MTTLIREKKQSYSSPRGRITLLATSFLAIFLFVFILMRSAKLAIPPALIFMCVPLIISHSRSLKQLRRIENLWPEILDLITSGIQSGLSLPQTLMSLSSRGPKEVRPIFAKFNEIIESGSNFDNALKYLKFEFSNSVADQVVEVLRVSQSSGSRDTSMILRTLAEFIASDLALREEIRAKHSWIRNSALLASATPWVLLLLLTSQEKARDAFSSTSGMLVLLVGVLLTAAAFSWMSKVGKLEVAPRVFIN